MVTIYIPKNSIVHSIPFIIKIIILALTMFAVHFYKDNVYVVSAIILGVVMSYIVARILLIYLWRALHTVLPILIGIALYNLIFNTVQEAYYIVVQISTAIGLSNLLSITTPLHKILEPHTKTSRVLSFCKVPVPVLRLMINIILRTVPILIQERKAMQSVCRLRGYYWRYILIILFPLLLRVIVSTDVMVDALDLRGLSVLQFKKE